MKYYVEAYGCTLNKGETKMLAEDMACEGHIEVKDPVEADTAVIGTCVVIKKTEERMKRRINELKECCDQVIVTGCLASIGGKKLKRSIPGIKLVEAGDVDISLEPQPSLIGTVPISNGCLGSCTYCITKIARGDLKSKCIDRITKRFERLIESGVKEVRVTCQDTASYGLDIDTNLIELMKELDSYPGKHRIRLGMMNPNTALPIKEGLIECMDNSHFYRFLHLPLQSGSNSVLERMGREYTVKQWIDLIQDIRKSIPDITISTDVIPGFPGESKEDFNRTVSILDKVKPDIVNITRFSPRPATKAMDMEDKIHSREKKRRSKILTDLHAVNSKKNNEEFIGIDTKILVLEKGKNDTMMGRMNNYKVVVIDDYRDGLLGEWVDVNISDAHGVYLSGTIN